MTGFKKSVCLILFLFSALAITTLLDAHSPGFTDTFGRERCNFTSTGRNPFFILVPGFEATIEGDDDGEIVKVVITVLDETKIVDGVETRVVRERETANGELVEISRNYFAICRPSNSVFYFGEDVNIYEDGQVVSHDGAWKAGVNGARPGIVMPGTILNGSRYFQEVAPGVALDRAEHAGDDVSVSTPFADFTHCLHVRETTPLEPGHVSHKYYCPGFGLVKDGPAELVNVTQP